MTSPPAAGRLPGADYQELFEQAPCGYLLTADDGTILAVNDTFVRWSGHQRDALCGARLQSFMPVGDRIVYATTCIPQLGTSGAVAEVAVQIVGADGERRAALLSASRIVPDGDEPAHVRVIVFSAHERRAYEQELVAARRRAEESEARRALAEADLQHRVLHDPLTGLPNRPGLVQHLARMATTEAAAPALGLLFIDLDHFKAVNDSLGHAAGDELLLVVADRLRATVRESSVVARLAGDEFVVIERITAAAQLGVLAQRLLEALNVPVVVEGLEIVPTASIGVVVSDPPDADADELLRRADIAMYRAKALGRNRWEQHDPCQPDPTADRLRLLGELRRGIEDGDLRLHYQPRMDLRTGRVDGVEALVRWEHPTRGMVPPGDFIAVAEEAGLIRSLGEWVLHEAFAQARRWNDDPEVGRLGMAVNLSARQLSDARLVPLVADALRRHGLEPGQITLEITETAVMLDPDAALRSLLALKELGVHLAVDDFGTGYSSLTYLNRFPVDELKIDQSFVAGLGVDRGDSVIVTSCIQLAHAMGVIAVAEGIETQAHHDVLVGLGCDLGQGYLYSRPLAAPALAAWVREQRPLSLAGTR